MSLFADRSSGVDESTLTTDLFTISWNDGNLGQGADTTINGDAGGITSIPAAPITYTPSVTTGMASADRLFELVNTSTTLNWGNPILITALDGGNDPYSGLNIDGNGITYLDELATPNVIHIVYDTSQFNGQGLSLYDTSGDPIQTPNAVLLYHELSHAFHRAIDQRPFPQTECPDDPSDEPAAEIDENVLRAQLGLCLRDVCNHGGQPGWGKACGGSATPGGPPLVDGDAEPPDDGGCFVVTAATGSPQADEIRHLRMLRDRVAARSRMASDLIAAIYDEYSRFGPGVAAAIADDGPARTAVLRLVVRPLFAWYALAERLALHPEDCEAVERRLEAARDACPPELVPSIVPLLRRLGDEAPPGAPFAFESLFAQMSGLPRAAWALHAPLLAAWTRGEERGGLVEAVAEWLAAAPVETLAPPPGDAADQELSELARLFDFAPAARRRLGRRLHAAWPAQAQALRRHGFGGRNNRRQPA